MTEGKYTGIGPPEINRFELKHLRQELSKMAVTAKKKPKKSKSSVKLQPLGDRIVVDRDEVGDVTTGGIYLPENAKEKPIRGTVVSVGDGRLLADGSRAPLQVKKGDKILFTTYAPNEIKIDGEELLLMREEDVLAIID